MSQPLQDFPGRPRRVALVGAGWIADAHAEVLAGIEGVRLVAVCDPDRARAEKLARRFGIPRVETSVEALSPADVDLVHLLVPPDLHERLARELLEKGLGVFVEKPLALSATAARALADLAERKGLPFGANHNFVHHPAFVRLLARVRAGEIGRVEHVRAVLATPLAQLEAFQFGHWMFRAPANIVYEQAVHPLSLVRALVGKADRVEPTILSTRELLPGQLFHDRWSVAATAGGASVELHLAFGAGFEQFRIEVRGTDGVLEADLRGNALSGEGKSRWLEFWDGYLATSRRGAMLRRDARRVLSRYLKSTLGLGRRDDGFFASMRGSIEAFHRSPPQAADAVEVLAWCDAIARVAAPPAPTRKLPEPAPPRPNEVCVLGANGFIGRRTVLKLLERGLPVTAVVRRLDALPTEITQGAADGRVRIVRARLEDRASLDAALAGAKSVVHLATGGGDAWDEVYRSMVKGTAAAAEAALDAGATRFVYVSSIAALDTGRAGAIEDSLATDPSPDARPVYARGKIAAEKALLALRETRGLPLVIARPGVVMGAGTPMQHSGLGLWTRDNHCVGWGAGEHPLPLVWVDDVADALARIVAHAGHDLDGKALNLCASPDLGAREFVFELARASGRSLHFHARPLVSSQLMEIGKWIVKTIGGRRDAEFPSWHDLRARSLSARIPSGTARAVLGWKPVDEREAFLDRTVRIHAPAPPPSVRQ
ncbi:MAG: NAD-dependent epimerase/dehydratase family protein [Planctomycetota bacterium]